MACGFAPNKPKNVQKKKYLLMAVVTVALGTILYSFVCTGVKERVKMPSHKRQPGEPSQLSRIFKCKPLVLVLLMGVLSSGRYMVSAAAIHVARYSFYIGPDLATLVDDAARNAAIEASISTVKTVLTVWTPRSSNSDNILHTSKNLSLKIVRSAS